MSARVSTLRLAKEDMKFSAGHFTIFSASERERLHGHNFAVAVEIEAEVLQNGMCFDYGVYKKIIRSLCEQWDEYFILPGESPYLTIEREGDCVFALFNGERIPFLAKDVLILPIANATLEEFSRLMLASLTADPLALERFKIRRLRVAVSSGPGQSADASWIAPSHSTP